MQLMSAGIVLGMAMTSFYCSDCNYNAAGGDVLQEPFEKPFFAVSQIEEEGTAS